MHVLWWISEPELNIYLYNQALYNSKQCWTDNNNISTYIANKWTKIKMCVKYNFIQNYIWIFISQQTNNVEIFVMDLGQFLVSIYIIYSDRRQHLQTYTAYKDSHYIVSQIWHGNLEEVCTLKEKWPLVGVSLLSDSFWN